MRPPRARRPAARSRRRSPACPRSRWTRRSPASHVGQPASLRAPELAGGAPRGLRGARLSHPGRDARRPRAAPADRHGRSDHLGDLPAYGRGGGGRDRAPADHQPRLLAPPHGLPGTDHDRLGDVHALLQGRRQLARAARLPAHALPQRPRLQPAVRGRRSAPRLRGAPEGARRVGLLPLRQASARAHRGDSGLGRGRDGARLRARDLHLPGGRSGRSGHGEGARRARLPRGRVLVHGVVRRADARDALVVGLLGHRRSRATPPRAPPRRARPSWPPRSRSASASSATCSPSRSRSGASRRRRCDAAAHPGDSGRRQPSRGRPADRLAPRPRVRRLRGGALRRRSRRPLPRGHGRARPLGRRGAGRRGRGAPASTRSPSSPPRSRSSRPSRRPPAAATSSSPAS